MSADITVDLPRWTQGFADPARYKIAYGGRGSGKSWAFARMLLLRAASQPTRILCARELQNSIQDSVHQLLSDQIRIMGLTGSFAVLEGKITSRCGSEFLFKGLRGMKNNAQALKSIEGVDVCWIEEGQTVSDASLKTLTPTIRKPGAEIWITFNPDQETDPVYRIAMDPPAGSWVRKVNYDSNPWFHETSLPDEMEWMRRTDADAYAHVWLGECRRFTDAQILRGKTRIEAFDPGPDWDGPYYGADWGFATDPTALVKLWIHDRNLYVEHEAYGVGVEIDHTPALFDTVPGSRTHIIRADSARPETISFMCRQGFSVTSADKGKGSVEDGIAHLRSYASIVIHPRCVHFAEEARLYSYKADRLSGDIMPVPVDAHNHLIDAARYALEPIMQRGTGRMRIDVPTTTTAHLSSW